MSECVVRMEMPKCCDECPMEYDGFMCDTIHKRFYPKKDGCYLDPLIDPSKERLPDCPIICALPEGHGRLVDINIVAERIKDAEELSEFCDEFEFGGKWTVDLSKIPTIVPAEEKLEPLKEDA